MVYLITYEYMKGWCKITYLYAVMMFYSRMGYGKLRTVLSINVSIGLKQLDQLTFITTLYGNYVIRVYNKLQKLHYMMQLRNWLQSDGKMTLCWYFFVILCSFCSNVIANFYFLFCHFRQYLQSFDFVSLTEKLKGTHFQTLYKIMSESIHNIAWKSVLISKKVNITNSQSHIKSQLSNKTQPARMTSHCTSSILYVCRVTKLIFSTVHKSTFSWTSS